MKTLILLRHAKAISGDASMPDKARPLAERGRIASPQMGQWLAQQGYVPDHVLVSTAVRTRETWALVEPELAGATFVDHKDDLYLASATHLLATVRHVPDAAHTLLMIGHNPGMAELALGLTGSGAAALRRAMAFKFPTAAAAVLTFDGERWQDMAMGAGRLAAFATPKELTDD